MQDVEQEEICWSFKNKVLSVKDSIPVLHSVSSLESTYLGQSTALISIISILVGEATMGYTLLLPSSMSLRRVGEKLF